MFSHRELAPSAPSLAPFNQGFSYTWAGIILILKLVAYVTDGAHFVNCLHVYKFFDAFFQ